MTEEFAVRDDPSPDPPAMSDPVAPVGSAAGGAAMAENLSAAIEAILLTIDKPVPALRLAEALGLVAPSEAAPASEEGEPRAASKPRRKRTSRAEGEADPVGLIERAIEDLNRSYSSTGRSFRIEHIAGGFRIMTQPAFAPAIAAFHRARASNRLSRAAIETLAIIAYKQPITRAHLEAIRGVNCGEVLRSLMERRLVCIRGRSEELGRPILYGTDKEFLDAFGLASLKDLPSASELQVTP